MYTFDYNLFLWLNFDGGHTLDRVMQTISGTTMWIPLYALILILVWYKSGWRSALIFIVLVAAALGLADMISGIFKQSGLLSNLMPSFEARPRPMFVSALEGLPNIAPDSMRLLRRADTLREWAVHVPSPTGGLYGTVSAHAATIVALTVLSCKAIRRRWFVWLMCICAVVICYSRIYLAKHFPMDVAWGILLGLALGFAAYWGYRKLNKLLTLHQTKS